MIQPRQPPRRAALVFILVTIALDVFAMGVVIPIFPSLIVNFLGGNTPKAAEIYGLLGTIWGVMQFLVSPLVGVLSDRFGRRPIALLSNFGLGLDYILMALAPSLSWLFVGRVISGITASSVSTAMAYIADVTPREKRAGAFGMIGAAWGVGFVLGPALGGLLGGINPRLTLGVVLGPALGGFLGNVNPRLPFWLAAGLSLANATYGLFVLPESLPPERRQTFSWRRANPVGSLGLFRSDPELLGLAVTHFLYILAQNVLPSIFVLYASYRYGWDVSTVGFMLAGVGIISIVVQSALVKPTIAHLGERLTLAVGLLSAAVSLTIYGLATTGHMFWIGVPIAALWGLYVPAAQSLMTGRVGPTEQGRLQGAIASLTGIAGIIGPGMFALIFAHFIAVRRVTPIPGAPFLFAAALMGSAMVLAWHVTRSPAETPHDQTADDS